MSIRFEVHALPSCQIAVDYDVMCPYGVHAHVENEVLRTRRTLDPLASRRCSVTVHQPEPSHSVRDVAVSMCCHRAKDYNVLCPFGVHAHVENEVLRTRRTLDPLAPRRCSVTVQHTEPSHSAWDVDMSMHFEVHALASCQVAAEYDVPLRGICSC